MDDARSTFTAGKDTKAIVYFEWEGPLGPHHFEGLWKSPAGRIVLVSDFSYEAKTTHFSGYWTMLLADSTPSGEWSIEANTSKKTTLVTADLVRDSRLVGSYPFPLERATQTA